MDGPRNDHTWRSKVDRERQMLYDITYMWNLINNINELISKQKQTHRPRKQSYGCQKGRGADKLGVWN